MHAAPSPPDRPSPPRSEFATIVQFVTEVAAALAVKIAPPSTPPPEPPGPPAVPGLIPRPGRPPLAPTPLLVANVEPRTVSRPRLQSTAPWTLPPSPPPPAAPVPNVPNPPWPPAALL